MQYSLKAKSADFFPAETFDLSSGRKFFSVGRSERNDLQVDQSAVSAHHADLKLTDSGGWEVVDRESSNGTFVNGEKVERHSLAPGDVLRFASYEFQVVEASPETGGDFEIQLAVANKELDELKRELRGLKDQYQKQEGEIAQKTSQSSGLDQDLSSARQDVSRLERDLKVQKEEVAARNVSIQSLGAEVKDLKKELKKAEASSLSSETKAADREKKLENEVAELKVELSKRQGDLEAEVMRKTELKSELERSEGTVNRLQNELEVRQRDLADRDTNIRNLDAQTADLSRQLEQWKTGHAEMERALAERDEALRMSHATAATAEERLSRWVARLDEFSDALLQDWKEWGVDDLNDEEFQGEHAALDRAEAIRGRIRGQLDEIEPIWTQYGNQVEAELKNRKSDLQQEIESLSEELSEKNRSEEGLEKDLADLRSRVDNEVRRAQGLSRKGIEVEIPERFESMVIARDEEQRIYVDLIDRLEFFDKLLDGYRRSRKLKDVVEELEEFRHRFHHILATHGVEPFQVEVGTMLTPKHRREVRILAKKGWGTKEHGEKTFRPGEVTKIVRHGYRSGEGKEAVILRKVEVLIRDAEG